MVYRTSTLKKQRTFPNKYKAKDLYLHTTKQYIHIHHHQPDTPDGKFYKSKGFISHVHAGKNPYNMYYYLVGRLNLKKGIKKSQSD